MYIVIFTAVIGAIMIFVKYREYKKCKQVVDNAITNRKFEKFDYSKGVRILYYIFILFGLISAGYGIYEKSDDTVAMGIIIAMLFIAELIMVSYKYVLYYNNTQFIVKGEVLRLKSIKHFEKITNFKYAFVKVIMMNGDKYAVSPKAYDILDQKLTDIRHK